MIIPKYPIPSNIQQLATQKTLDSQQKQAAIFSGGGGISVGTTAPNMGGNNEQAQQTVNELTRQMVAGHSLASMDKRVGGVGGGRGKYRTRRKKGNSRRKKHNKRITKRKHYKRR
jgi:hypothetical protein